MRFTALVASAVLAGLTLSSLGSAQAAGVEFPAASPASTIQQRVGLTDIEVVYSRPSMRGRKIFGAMIPYGEVWRTGANAATRLTFSTAVKLEGTSLAAGAYELFTIPGKKEWTIILQKLPEKASWGAYSYKQEHDTARVTVKPITTPQAVETFIFGFTDLRDTGATMIFAWENSRIPIKIETDTVGMLLPQIRAAIASGEKQTWNFYYGAAALLYDNGGDLAQALVWVDESIKLREGYPGNLLLKTRILAKLGRNAEAKIVAAKASESGIKLEGPNSVMARQARDISHSLK